LNSPLNTPVLKIIKSSGEKVLYQPEKLQASLVRSGASGAVADAIVNDMAHALHDGIATRDIYKMAFRRLKALRTPAAVRYKARRAIMELGPTGFIFERYLGALLKAQGYSIQLNQVLAGACVSHEVDIVAAKDGQQHFMECKYHNADGIICDVKIPLYFHARFNDLTASCPEPKSIFTGWIITNTKFSQDAITYGTCAGLKLLSWNYPFTDNLKDWIDRLALYPVTALTTLSQSEKAFLLEQNILLCKEVPAHTGLLADLRMAPARVEAVLQEVASLA
jgi:hypothetical protein